MIERREWFPKVPGCLLRQFDWRSRRFARQLSCHYCRHCHCHCRCHHYCRHCHCYHHFRRHHCKYHRKAEERICAETMSPWLCLCGTGTDIDRKTKTNIILVIIIAILSRSSSSSSSSSLSPQREDESRLVVLVVPLRRSWQNPAPCAVGPRLLGRREGGRSPQDPNFSSPLPK